MDKKNQDIIFKIGVAVGVYFFVVKPLLEKLGLSKTAEQEKFNQDEKTAQTSLASPFSPRYWHDQPAPKTIITTKEVTKMAQDLYNSLNRGYLGDDINTILSTFRKLKFKTQVSYLAEFFANKYKLDLYNTLKDGVRRTIDRFTPGNRTGLSDSELQKVIDIVSALK
jgi:hypothetical protein